MINKKVKKFLTCIVISILLFTNVFTILPELINLSTYASSTNLEEQDTVIQNTNSDARFDAYFIDGSHSKAQNMSSEPKVAIELQTTTGTMSDIVISFKDLNDTTDVNYQLPPSISFADSTIVPTVDTTNMTVSLNTTISNARNIIQIPLRIYSQEDYKLEYLNQTTKVVLNATYTDASGNQTPISHEIKINLSWQDTLVMEIGQRIERFIPYDIDGKKGVLVETAIVSKLNTEGMYSSLPIKQTNLQLEAPQFAGINPTTVEVKASRLLATNGEIGTNITFGTNNWSYDSTTRAINITVENKNTSYVGRGSDEFILTYDYPEAAYNLVDPTNGVAFATNVTGTIQYYSGTTLETTTTVDNDTIILKEQIGILVENDTMPKTQFYLNSIDSSYNRPFPWTSTDSLHMTDGGDTATYAYVFHHKRFKDAEGNIYSTYVDGVPYDVYQSTKIAKDTFERVLGIDGYIKIYDENQNYLGVLNTSSTLDNEGFYIFEYTTAIGSIILETSVPIDFTNTLVVINKTITLPTLPYTREQIREFTEFASLTDWYGKAITATSYEYLGPLEGAFKLKDGISNAYLSITNPTLREAELNEDVTFNITLQNIDWEDDDLFVNPIFQIDLPNYIEKMEIKDVYITLGDYFTIKSQDVIKRADGGYSIRLELEGTQNRIYTTPTQIEIITDITTKQVIPNLTQEVELLYYNEHAKNYKRETANKIEGVPATITKVGLATSEIDFVGTNDLTCYATITNFDELNTEISSISTQNVGIIAPKAEAKIAQMDLNIINGYTQSCGDIIIIGRIPFQNNKYAISNEDLGSIFSTALASQITTTNTDLTDKMIVYYSENPDATTDLTLETNGWTTTYTEQNNFKSYLIVLENYELTSGNTLNFSYDFEIPANVGYEKEVYANFGVYYTKEETQANKETKKIGLKTLEEPQLLLEKAVSAGHNETVSVGDIIKYTITAKNTGNVDIKNVKIIDTIPEGTIYVQKVNGQYQKDETIQQVVENITLLQAGKSETLEFEVEIDEIIDNSSVVNNIAIAESEDLEDPIESPEVVNPVVRERVSITKTSSVNEQTYIKEGDNFEYYFTVKNTGGEILEQVILTDTLPEGITYIQGYYITNNQGGNYTEITEGVAYDEQTRKVTWNIGTMEIDEIIEMKLVVQSNQITDNSKSKRIENIATITAQGDVSKTTPVVVNNIANIDIQIEKEADIQEYRLLPNRDITYTITLTNNSPIAVENLTITDELSDLIQFKEAYIVGENGEQIKQGVQYNQVSHTVTWEIEQMASEESIKVKIIATTKEPTQTEEELNNIAVVTGDDIPKTESNEVEKMVIKEDEPVETRFDLALDKTIKSITVTNNSKTYTNAYDGTKMTKIDISERLLNETIVEIEYEIMVVNQGNVPGYAKKIVDYMPIGTTFNQQDNPNWTLENGKLYYNGLENEMIDPGENRTITVTLKKQVSENNVGSIINEAEIYEDYNAEQAEDINSTPNNNDEKENDHSKAELVISIRTGKTNTYIELILTNLGILGMGIYFIKKKVI